MSANVTAAAQAMPRPSDTAFRQVVGEQVARTGMPPLDLPNFPSGVHRVDMMAVDGSWGYDSHPWHTFFCVAVVIPCLVCTCRLCGCDCWNDVP